MAEGRTAVPALVYGQIRYQNKRFWRTAIAAFFTLIFPLMFLIIFNLLFGGDVTTPTGEISIAQFFAPSLAVFAAASATYTNIGVSTAIDRDQGILKRMRGTPLLPWIHMAGRVGASVWIASIAVTIMLAVGVIAYDVEIRSSTLAGAIITFLLGVACFAALGLALAAFAPSGDGAPAIANATLLPIAFISDVFIPVEDPPEWLVTVGDIFPLKHFVNAFQDAFNPFTTDAAFRWGDWGVMVLWGAAGLALALRYSKWEPRAGDRPGRKGRRKGAETVAA